MTVGLACLALACFLLGRGAENLFYTRAGLINGEGWRAWSGHFVHYNLSHLLWNLAVFVPVGVWLERLEPWPARVFLILGAPLISAVIFAFDPGLERYGGLSGLAAGAVVLLAGLQLAPARREPVWLWAAVLGLVVAKIGWELISGDTLLVKGASGVRNVPLAHLGGVLAAGLTLAGWHLFPERRVRSTASPVAGER